MGTQRHTEGEELYLKKFSDFGLTETFEYIKRDWDSDHGKKVFVKCKSCGAVFSSWAVYDVFRSRQTHVLCCECGASSDGVERFSKTSKADEAMRYYVKGHSVKETADRFGVTSSTINNIVKKRRLTNGRTWREAANEYNQKRSAEAEEKYRLAVSEGMADYKKIRRKHKQRAIKFGCEYDPTVNLKSLIARDGLTCKICGGLCNQSDHGWSKYYGPTSPTIDHILPMAKGGSHTWDNVQIAHAVCNIKKRDTVQWEGGAE